MSKQWSKIQRNQFLNYTVKKHNLYLSFPNSFKNGFSSTPNADTVATGDQRRLGLFPLLFETCEFPVNETHQMWNSIDAPFFYCRLPTRNRWMKRSHRDVYDSEVSTTPSSPCWLHSYTERKISHGSFFNHLQIRAGCRQVLQNVLIAKW